MANTKDIILGGKSVYLFIGPNKSGKTVGAVTFPGPVMIYNFDGPGRMQPIKFMWPDLEIEYKNVGSRKISHPDPDKAVMSFVEFCEEFQDLQDSCPYGTVIIDSFTALSTTAVTFQLSTRLGRDFKLKDVKTTKGGLPIASWDEFNGETTAIAMILEVAKILPCNVIMTAHPLSKTETNSEGVVTRRFSTIAAYGHKVAQIVPGYFTEIWRFTTESSNTPGERPNHFIYTTSVAEDFASTAMPLPGKINITNRRLFDAINRELADEMKKRASDLPSVSL